LVLLFLHWNLLQHFSSSLFSFCVTKKPSANSQAAWHTNKWQNQYRRDVLRAEREKQNSTAASWVHAQGKMVIIARRLIYLHKYIICPFVKLSLGSSSQWTYILQLRQSIALWWDKLIIKIVFSQQERATPLRSL